SRWWVATVWCVPAWSHRSLPPWSSTARRTRGRPSSWCGACWRAPSRCAGPKLTGSCPTGCAWGSRPERCVSVAHAASCRLFLRCAAWHTGTSVLVHGARPGADPATRSRRDMKADIHPQYVETQVTCTCGNSFTTRSTKTDGVIRAEVCSACHPFYTGKQKILDTGGRVARFEARYGKKKA